MGDGLMALFGLREAMKITRCVLCRPGLAMLDSNGIAFKPYLEKRIRQRLRHPGRYSLRRGSSSAVSGVGHERTTALATPQFCESNRVRQQDRR